MVPSTIMRQLRALRAAEFRAAGVWGLGRGLACAVALLAVGCALDWYLDRDEPTPQFARVLFFLLQVGGLVTIGFYLIVRPLRSVPAAASLAERVESRVPEYRHRLVTALQLNRPDADTAGMSPGLITNVTAEAERVSAGRDFAAFADRDRLRRGVYAGGAALLVAAVAFLIAPRTVAALLARQFLAPVALPRDVTLADRTAEVWPAGEPVIIEFLADDVHDRGPELAGSVTVEPDEGVGGEYPLEYAGGSAYRAEVPASSVDFTYTARLGDGRTEVPRRVRFAPRPVVNSVRAWLVTPAYVGRDPDGRRYRTAQPQGRVRGGPGFTGFVEARAQKSLTRGVLDLLKPDDAGGEAVVRSLPMTIAGDTATAEFELADGVTGYRVRVFDEYDFRNAGVPRRDVAFDAEFARPAVDLLPERFFRPGDRADALEREMVEDLPWPVGKPLPIDYRCESPLGLWRARLAYRVNDGGWRYVPLGTDNGKLVAEVPTGGPEFYRLKSAGGFDAPDGLDGGGSLELLAAGLEPPAKVGDTVEYRVEVFNKRAEHLFEKAARARPPEDLCPPGASPSRFKRVVTDEEFRRVLFASFRTLNQLRSLRDRQRRLFGGD